MVDIKALQIAVNFLKSVIQHITTYHDCHIGDTETMIGSFIGEKDRSFLLVAGGIIETQLNITDFPLQITAYSELTIGECKSYEILHTVELIVYCAEKFIRDYQALS